MSEHVHEWIDTTIDQSQPRWNCACGAFAYGSGGWPPERGTAKVPRNGEIDTVCREWGAAIDAFRADRTEENRKCAEATHTRLMALIKDVFGPIPVNRPECFEFAMSFLGDPEETIVRAYVEALERDAQRTPRR